MDPISVLAGRLQGSLHAQPKSRLCRLSSDLLSSDGESNAEKATAVRTIGDGSDSQIVHLHLPS